MYRNSWAIALKWHHWTYRGLLFQFETARPSSFFILHLCGKGSGETALSLCLRERGILYDSPWSFERRQWRCGPLKLITLASCDKEMRMSEAFRALLRSLLIKEQPLSSSLGKLTSMVKKRWGYRWSEKQTSTQCMDPQL